MQRLRAFAYPTLVPDPDVLPQLARLDARVPKCDLQRLRARPCPSCGSINPAVLRRPDRLPVSYCAECALWYVCATPSEAEIRAFYENYWLDHRAAKLDDHRARTILQRANDSAWIDWRIQRLTSLMGTLKGKVVLEIGAGTGEFLSAVRCAGASVIANEISTEACDFLEQSLGLAVIRGELFDADCCCVPDAIVMSDLIEHPVEPITLLSRAVNLLRPGGLLMIWTPNGGNAGEERTTAQSWVGFRVDLEHLQYFSTRTMHRLAETLGLHIEHLESTGYPGLSGIDRPPWRDAYRRGRVLATIKALIKRLAPRRMAEAGEIAREMRRPRARGSYHLFVIFRKPL